jgi:xylulokinase
MTRYVIGVDVGSQSIKAVLVDDAGSVTATAAAPLAMSHPHSGWAEQSPAEWVSKLTVAVCEVAHHARGRIDAIGLASQVDGVVAVDGALSPVHDALIWLDRRAVAQTSAFVERSGDEELFAVTGLNADASHGAPKMMWLRENRPDAWAQTQWLLPVGGYLVAWLTGECVQDPANASSSMLYDLGSGKYSDALCAAADLDPALLPRVDSATSVAGTLTSEAAEALCLSVDCRVVVGTGDEHAASLSAGVTGSGVIADVTGTAEPVTSASTEAVFDETRLVETHAHAIDGVFLIENPGFVSGGSTLWLSELFKRPQADVFDLAARAPAGSDGVTFLPALTGAMTPRWNAEMRGSFSGLSINHGQEHLARAVIEGCAFAVRDVVDRLEAMGLAGDEVRIVGGGGRSALWNQIKADVLGRPVRRVLSKEGCALGAAMLAGVAAGIFSDVPDAVERTIELDDQQIVPDDDCVAVYAEAYDGYRSTFDAIEGVQRP